MLVIEVQCCQNCERHNWCSRHNQAKYQQFSSSLEARLQQFHPHLSYTKNQPPPHYSKKTLFSNLGFPIESYYDQNKKEIAIFPRHGAFQVTVNGILIFSKLQSNVWPNIDRVAQVVAEMREDIENGDDIKKYSIDYRMSSLLEERSGGKEKKSVKFKISKRPKSNQFNGNIFTKGNKDQLGERVIQKNRTVDGASKPKMKHRQSEISKKSLIKLKIKKNQSAHSINNLQSTHSITNNQQIIKIEQQLPHFARKIEGNESALMLNKRLQQKKQILRQVKSQQLKSMANKGYIKLQKKCRNLVIESNKSNRKKEQQAIMTHNVKIEQIDNNGQQIIFFKTPLKPQHQQQKRQERHQQQSIKNLGVFESNTIEVEDYQSQQQINTVQSQATMVVLQQNNEVKQQHSAKMKAIYIEDSISDHFDVKLQIANYWNKLVEQIIQSLKLKSIQPLKQLQQQIKEDQEQGFMSESEVMSVQNRIQDIIEQQPMLPNNEEHQLINACSEQQIKQAAPITEFCELENKQCEILEQQQLPKQDKHQYSNKLENIPKEQINDSPLQAQQISSNPQYFQQLTTNNAIQQAAPKQSFALDHMPAHDLSLNIQQLLIKQQSKHFSQELTNKILQNTRLIKEEQIRQMIQNLQQNAYNQFNLNEDINNSGDNIGITFQLTKEQGFFQGKRQWGAVKLQELKRLQERDREEELQYSVYSEDPKEKFIEGRESKVNSLKAIQNEGDKIEQRQYSNHTIIEAQSSTIQPSYIVQAEGKVVEQQKQGMNTLVQLKQVASSQQLADNYAEQPKNDFTPQTPLVQQEEQKQPEVQRIGSQQKIKTSSQPFTQRAAQNMEKPQSKPLITSKSSIKKQNQPPSLKCISSMEDAKNSQAQRMLPNQTQTSISLSSQIRSQLSCLYYDIQARI